MGQTRDRAPPGAAGKLLLLGSLYLAQGLPYGFFTQAVPVHLRQHGYALELVGLSSLLALPWAMKFLWAPWIDRTPNNRLGRRRSWLLALQGASVLLLVGLAFAAERGAMAVLLAGVLATNLLSATQDIATDGLAVHLLTVRERGWANGLQVGGYRLGMVIGGGVLLIVQETVGWHGAFGVMAGIIALTTVPVLLLREPPSPAAPRARLRAAGFWRRPDAARLLLLILVFKGADAFAAGMVRPFLVDRGLGLAEIGWLLGSWGFAAAMGGALVGGLLVNPLGRRGALLAFGGLQAAAVAVYAYLAVGAPGPVGLALLVSLEHFVGGMSTAALFTCLMDWCSAETAATDYTIQASAVVIAMALGGALSGVSAVQLGYASHFVAATVLAAVAVLVAAWLFPRPHHQE